MTAEPARRPPPSQLPHEVAEVIVRIEAMVPVVEAFIEDLRAREPKDKKRVSGRA